MAKPTVYRCNECGWEGTEAEDCGLGGAPNCACPVCSQCCNLARVGPAMNETPSKKSIEEWAQQTEKYENSKAGEYKDWVEDLHRKGEIR